MLEFNHNQTALKLDSDLSEVNPLDPSCFEEHLLSSLTLAQSGGFFNFDGKSLPW